MAESGDVFDCPDRGEGLVTSAGWRLGMSWSLQSIGQVPGHVLSTCQGWEMAHSVDGLLHKHEDPRIHLKMASVGLERGLICQECSSRGPEFGSQPPILGDSQTLIIQDSRNPMTSTAWTLQGTHSQAHTDT